ncbi:alpha-glucosidase [Thermococcus stetteri]|uniref:alpha-glucosidase n=1 Tax=Thermococcus stetteri TaxID=49900 RepID=UPI001AE6BBE2|nr:alpha-glucosidase [Thermococcus stetteri]MBP1911975.1 putative membrane protein [Thermococcus stetteri]
MRSKEILLDTAEVIESTLGKIERLKVLSDKEKEAVKTKLRNAASNFRKLAEEAEKDNSELAEFFFKKAKELKLASVDKKIEEMGKKEYLKAVNRMELYSLSARYDFKPEQLAELKRVYRKYIFGMTSFFVLSGLYLNQFLAVTALIMAIPIILSMLALQRRGYLGLLLAYSAMPIPMIVGAMAVSYGVRTLNDPARVAEIAQHLSKSTAFAKGYLVLLTLLAAVELYLLISAAVGLYKHRHAFL